MVLLIVGGVAGLLCGGVALGGLLWRLFCRRFVRSLLHGLAPSDAATSICACILLLTVAALSADVPGAAGGSR